MPTLTKKQLLLFIPVGIIAALIAYSWTIIFLTDVYANWRHHIAAILFLPALFLCFKNIKVALFAVIVFLLIGSANLLSLTPVVETNSFGIQFGNLKLETPSFQLLSFGLLLLLLILNFDVLSNYYLDYKEMKSKQ